MRSSFTKKKKKMFNNIRRLTCQWRRMSFHYFVPTFNVRMADS
ncbi:hypothetical protein ALC57_09378 [Trachymyrmex cornetzi]|uniref:Uncharacterized protein n=1 Tax=Trachymyrmex cornetzi TaxID=471704 RepID=A0A195DZL2_9HYME|nr:hypothetical protein ALC57_09378 [Trachymyrmex cornetzi]